MSKVVPTTIIPPVVNPDVVEYIKWTHKEEGFTYIGILTHINSTHMIIATKFGDMTVARDDGEMDPSTKKEFEASNAYVAEPKVVGSSINTNTKPGSRTATAADIINTFVAGTDKKEIIDALVLHMGITRGNASIYYGKLVK